MSKRLMERVNLSQIREHMLNVQSLAETLREDVNRYEKAVYCEDSNEEIKNMIRQIDLDALLLSMTASNLERETTKTTKYYEDVIRKEGKDD